LARFGSDLNRDTHEQRASDDSGPSTDRMELTSSKSLPFPSLVHARGRLKYAGTQKLTLTVCPCAQLNVTRALYVTMEPSSVAAANQIKILQNLVRDRVCAHVQILSRVRAVHTREGCLKYIASYPAPTTQTDYTCPCRSVSPDLRCMKLLMDARLRGKFCPCTLGE
jgi:hypothetical protein